MNAYEEKKEARIERMRARAARLESAAKSVGHKYDALLGCMNGTPILVGHHSEKRHRRDLARIDAAFRKSLELQQQADELERRASASETSTAISSDDPEAVRKLKEKLEKLEALQERMRTGNRMLRAGKTDAEIAQAIGVKEASVADLRKPDFCGRTGFADYELSNNSAEIRRVRARIALLQTKEAAPPVEPVTIGEVRIEEDDNRVRVFFPGKPSEQVRSCLKRAGFRWSPTAGAWQRMASPAAWYEARRIAEAIGGLP